MSGVSGISNNFSFQLMVGEELKLVESTVFEYGWMPEIGELKKDIEKCLHENWKSSYLLIYTEFQINVNEKDSAKINPFWFLNTFLDAHNAKKFKEPSWNNPIDVVLVPVGEHGIRFKRDEENPNLINIEMILAKSEAGIDADVFVSVWGDSFGDAFI